MDNLKVCFIGVGSIAKRHIKNLSKICYEDKINLIIDVISRSGKENKEDIICFIHNIYSDISELKDIYDVFFITNPTEFHIETLNSVTNYGKNFFIEKPISSINQIESALMYKQKEGAVYYVACPLRYNAVIQYIKENINERDIISVRSISSSYLPDWRPGQDYRNTYSAHKDMGGGVSIDLIHEWDYLIYLFGFPQKIAYFGGRKSNLDIDSDDYAVYIAEYENKIVELHLDYFGRKTMREVTLITKNDTIVGDIANNKIIYMNSGKVINFNEERNDYQIRELRHFIQMINGDIKQDSGIKHAVHVLKLTQGRM